MLRILAARRRESRDRVDHVRGLVRAAATRLWGEVRAVRLREDAIGGDLCGGSAELRGLRVRDVPGERDEVAPLERDGKEVGRREAVEDDRAREARERSRRLRIRGARVDDDRLAEIGCERELGLEEVRL